MCWLRYITGHSAGVLLYFALMSRNLLLVMSRDMRVGWIQLCSIWVCKLVCWWQIIRHFCVFFFFVFPLSVGSVSVKSGIWFFYFSHILFRLTCWKFRNGLKRQAGLNNKFQMVLLSVVTTEISQIPVVGITLEYSICKESSCGYRGKNRKDVLI